MKSPHVFRFSYLLIGLMMALMLLGPWGVSLPWSQARGAEISIEEDPNDPMASKEERFRRQREIIRKRIEERREREKKKREDAARGGHKAEKKPAEKAKPKPKPPKRPAAPKQTQSKLDEATRKHATFYLWPASYSIYGGEEFVTQCQLANAKHLKIDQVQVVLSYPPRYLEPIAIHQHEIEPLLAGPPEVTIDDEGILHYRATFREPFDASSLRVLSVVWKALEPAESVWIRPSAGEEESGAFKDGKSLMSVMAGAENSVTGAHVRILQTESDVPQGGLWLNASAHLPPSAISLFGGAPGGGSVARNLALAEFPDQSMLRLPTLWIDQPAADQPLAEGDWLVIDLGVDNPDRMIFDEVRLAARYDPDAIEIVDADRDNWIDRGTNLLDGPFHELWPWNRHILNRVVQDQGYFYYRMGMETLREQPSGALARLFVHVKKPVEGPIFKWICDPDAPGERPQTGLFLMTENIYLRERNDIAAGQLLPDAYERADPAMYRF